MVPYKRQEKILELVTSKQFCKYSYLAQQLFVSPATIRRDTRDMENRGLIKRVLNGITLNEEPEDVPYDYSATLNLDAKRIAARRVRKIIQGGMSLF